MRGRVRGGLGLAIMRRGSVSTICIDGPMGSPVAGRVYDRRAAGMAVVAREATVIPSAAGSDKAMTAPTVVITPARPWTHA